MQQWQSRWMQLDRRLWVKDASSWVTSMAQQSIPPPWFWYIPSTPHSTAKYIPSQLARLSPTVQLHPGLLFLLCPSSFPVLVGLVVVTAAPLCSSSRLQFWALLFKLQLSKVVDTAILWANKVLHLSNSTQCYMLYIWAIILWNATKPEIKVRTPLATIFLDAF